MPRQRRAAGERLSDARDDSRDDRRLTVTASLDGVDQLLLAGIELEEMIGDAGGRLAAARERITRRHGARARGADGHRGVFYLSVRADL